MKKLSIVLASALLSTSVMAADTSMDNSGYANTPSDIKNSTTTMQNSIAPDQTTTPASTSMPSDNLNMGKASCQGDSAQCDQMHQQMLQKWQAMTPDQKAAMQQQMKAKWDQMTPAEKQMMQEKMVQKWQAMSPAEQQQMLDNMKNAMNNSNNAATIQ